MTQPSVDLLIGNILDTNIAEFSDAALRNWAVSLQRQASMIDSSLCQQCGEPMATNRFTICEVCEDEERTEED